MQILTVSQINRYIKFYLEEDPKLRDLYIKGEISNLRRDQRGGHLYFSLKDAGSAVRAVMFRENAELVPFRPEDGLEVLVRARVGVYEASGMYQLYITDMQPDGVGSLALAFAQTKERLAAQGLFDPARKKALPAFPRRVGIVTSKSGAALQDILSVLERRYPLCTAVVAPAQVQGKEAARSLIHALECLDEEGSCDIIILGRGGGSAEDLHCFNDESLARAVFLCHTPVISAVGHETDDTICDLVADHRAPTPSAAAELAVPHRDALVQTLEEKRALLARQAGEMLLHRYGRLVELQRSKALLCPDYRVEQQKEKLDFFAKTLYNKSCMLMAGKERELAAKAALLQSLSPLNILQRGYSITLRNTEPVGSVQDLNAGDTVDIRLHDGVATALVQRTAREDNT